MSAIPSLDVILLEQGDEPLPDPTSGARFRRAFLHGEPFTAAEVTRRFDVSGTVLANTVKGLREYGYTIQSTPLAGGEVLHRVTNVGFVPEPLPTPPPMPTREQWTNDYVNRADASAPAEEPPKPKAPPRTGGTARAREALDAGITITPAYAKAHDLHLGHIGQMVRTHPDKYERVKVGTYRKRQATRAKQGTGALSRITERLEAGEIVDWEWADANGISRQHVHTAISHLRRKKGYKVVTLQDKQGYRLHGRVPAKTPAKAEREDTPPAVDLPAYPQLGEELTVRGVSLTDDGTLQIALRNGVCLWVAEVVGQHRLAETSS